MARMGSAWEKHSVSQVHCRQHSGIKTAYQINNLSFLNTSIDEVEIIYNNSLTK